MSISKRVIDALEWAQLGFLAFFAGIAFGIAFGWVVGACVACGFLAISVLFARGMKAALSKSLQTAVAQQRFPTENVP